MVSFFKAPKAKSGGKKKRHSGPSSPQKSLLLSDVQIDGIDHQGIGVAKEKSDVRGPHPVMFVEGALPGEVCNVRVEQQKKQVWFGRIESISTSSRMRVPAFCPHSAECGGCQLDYVNPEDTRKLRREAIDQMLARIARVTDYQWQSDICAPPTGYRRKTRLAIDARDSDDVRVGFRQQGSNRVIDIPSCAILTKPLQGLLTPIRDWLNSGSHNRLIGHVTLLAGDEHCLVSVRCARPLGQDALLALQALGDELNIRLEVIYPDGQVAVLSGEHQDIAYSPYESLAIKVGADDFVQVNAEVNQQMVEQALSWISEVSARSVMDLFCGTGNFSLPLAMQGLNVTGVEGVESMVIRAEQTAMQYALKKCRFLHHDLLDPTSVQSLLETTVDAAILDPSREGAAEVCRQLQPSRQPNLVYVSCNPASFARDTKMLVANGYELKRLALVEMFAYTKHTELISLFQPAPKT